MQHENVQIEWGGLKHHAMCLASIGWHVRNAVSLEFVWIPPPAIFGFQ